MNRFTPHRYRTRRLTTAFLMGVLMALSVGPAAAQMQQALAETTTEPLTLTLDEAIQIALVNNYAIRNNRPDVDNAQAQIREAWSDVLPQVDATSSYTRNLKTANPFAGSEAGNFFSTLGFVGWLSFNEDARRDNDPVTVPITFDEYQDRLFDGLDQAGVVRGNDANPFG
ncbi:MAG: TolC family protein, partial [Bacteroidetes bacterium]|nr:TolC family protein [Bacteroidota bacterium]